MKCKSNLLGNISDKIIYYIKGTVNTLNYITTLNYNTCQLVGMDKTIVDAFTAQ